MDRGVGAATKSVPVTGGGPVLPVLRAICLAFTQCRMKIAKTVPSVCEFSFKTSEDSSFGDESLHVGDPRRVTVSFDGESRNSERRVKTEIRLFLNFCQRH